MNVQRLFAENMKDALVKVRDQLGEGAWIVESKRVPGGVEVSAARNFAADAPPPAAVDDTRRAIRTLADQLRLVGLNDQHATRLLSGLGAEQPVAALAKRLPVASHSVAPSSGCFALVGPAGAGKTTLCTQLMANRALALGSHGAELVTMDTWRAAAREQLSAMARWLHVPVSSVATADDVLRRARQLEEGALLVVDTPGIPVTEAGQAEMRRLVRPLADAMPLVLVVPATWSAAVLRRLFSIWSRVVDGVALTHLDESDSLLAPIAMAAEFGKPIWWTARNADIPDGLAAADSQALAESLWRSVYEPSVPVAPRGTAGGATPGVATPGAAAQTTRTGVTQ